MTESRFRKTIISATVGAVLLLVFLISIIVYQLFSIKVEKDKERQYLEDIERYEQLIKDSGEKLEARSAEWWLERRARELGMIKIDDEILQATKK